MVAKSERTTQLQRKAEGSRVASQEVRRKSLDVKAMTTALRKKQVGIDKSIKRDDENAAKGRWRLASCNDGSQSQSSAGWLEVRLLTPERAKVPQFQSS
jgi:hypothetical protein